MWQHACADHQPTVYSFCIVRICSLIYYVGYSLFHFCSHIFGVNLHLFGMYSIITHIHMLPYCGQLTELDIYSCQLQLWLDLPKWFYRYLRVCEVYL